MEASDTVSIKKIAIIGAGISNLTFLHSLKKNDKVEIHIFERSKVLSGRAATRKRNEYYFDNGANFFEAIDPKIQNIIHNQLSTENLVEIRKPIFQFDKNFKIDFDENNSREHNTFSKYTYKQGINHLGNLLLKNVKINYNLQFSKNITKIKQLGNNNWQLFCENEDLGIFDYIIFGVPSPNIARVLLNSEFNQIDKEFFDKSADVLISSTYEKTFSLSIAFEKSEFNENDKNYDFSKFFALVNSDNKSSISWVCVDNEKNIGESELYKKNLILNVQMSNEFSTANHNLPNKEALKIIIENLYDFFPVLKNKKINFSDLKLWGHSFPSKKLNDNLINEFAKRNIYVIGDALLEKGKIDGAMLTGVNLYEKLSAKF
jgi:predicted NAD/FAD-dependent oxidoreductase